MVGGVLVERTVKEVVPALVNNRDKVTCANLRTWVAIVSDLGVYIFMGGALIHLSDGKTDRKP